MIEKLQCTQCDARWGRQRTRGRKPLVCPTCADLNAQEGLPSKPKAKLAVASPVEKSTRIFKVYIEGPSEWQCNICSVMMKVPLGVTAIPLHRCSKKSNTTLPMEQIVRIKAKTF